MVTARIPVVARVVAAWGIAWTKWANPMRAANVMDIIWALGLVTAYGVVYMTQFRPASGVRAGFVLVASTTLLD